MLVDGNRLVSRRATAGDIDALISLRRQLLSGGVSMYAARSETEDRLWQEAYRAWLEKHIRESAARICVVVTESSAEQVVACATGIIDERAPMNSCLNGLVGWVQSVVVAPEWRRRGIGIRTVEFLMHWFAQKKVGRVALQCTPLARGLYEHLDFHASNEDLLICVSN